MHLTAIFLVSAYLAISSTVENRPLSSRLKFNASVWSFSKFYWQIICSVFTQTHKNQSHFMASQWCHNSWSVCWSIDLIICAFKVLTFNILFETLTDLFAQMTCSAHIPCWQHSLRGFFYCIFMSEHILKIKNEIHGRSKCATLFDICANTMWDKTPQDFRRTIAIYIDCFRISCVSWRVWRWSKVTEGNPASNESAFKRISPFLLARILQTGTIPQRACKTHTLAKLLGILHAFAVFAICFYIFFFIVVHLYDSAG